MLNRWLLLNPRGGTVSWLAIPFYVLFELLGPVVEAVGFVFFLAGALLGLIPWSDAAIFLLLALSLGMLLSVCAIMLEEFSYPVYRKPRDLALLYAAALLENFGYRQLTVWWRLNGFFRWVTRRQHKWETITRSASVGTG